MARYSRFKYSQGYYGANPAVLQYSVEPMSAFVFNYVPDEGFIQIDMAPPSGDFSYLRIVRNQDYYPETAEDGVIIYEKVKADVSARVYDTNYSNDYPAFVSGRYVYYRAWVKKNSDNYWYPAGNAYTLIPSTHSTKTSRNTARASIEEGRTFEVTHYEIDSNIATVTLREDAVVNSESPAGYAFEGLIRQSSEIRLYGVPSILSGIHTVSAVGPYTFSFPVTHADVSSTEIAGLVSLWPLEESGESNHSQSEYSDIELLSTHDKMMDFIPRVFTSTAQSPLDEVDTSSVLYRFMGAFAATLDETMTFVDLLSPQSSGIASSPTTLPLAANMYGLPVESEFAAKSQKRMVRDARSTFGAKGIPTAISTVVENITGYAPKVLVSENVMLSVQDSSFYEGIGFWKATTNATITATDMRTSSPLITIGTPSASEPFAVDTNWAGKVVVTTAGDSIVTGTASEVFTKGIPVNEGVQYKFSYYGYGSGVVKASIIWYDFLGTAIKTDVATGVTLAGAWLKDATAVFTSPAAGDVISGTAIIFGASYARVKIAFTSTGTYYLDMMSFARSSISAFEEARATNIFLYPTKYNLLKNPSFETYAGSAFNSWTVTGGTASQVTTTLDLSYGESKMMNLVTTTSTATVSSTTATGIAFNNSFYTFSIYAKATTSTKLASLTLLVSDGTNTVSHTTVPAIALTTSWKRIYVTLQVPQSIDPTLASLTASVSFTGPAATISLDNAQLEVSYVPTDYFDGSIGYIHGGFWQGTEQQSASYFYANIMAKMPRLIAALPDYIPFNTPYTISTEYRLEYKSILL